MPRTYPPRFALRVVKYYNRFCNSRECLLEESVDNAGMNAMDVFALLSWEEVDSWSDGNLIAVVYYLRGSKQLELEDWRKHFPVSFPL